MAIFLALATAAAFGAGDFIGGSTSRKTTPIHVVSWSHVVGLALVLPIAIAIPNTFIFRDVAVGAGAGLFGLTGVILLYRCLAVGPMSVVAPLTAISASVVPATWGLATGESLPVLGWVGAVLAITAVGLISVGKPKATDAAKASTQTIVEALLAGVGFGLLFIALDTVSDESAPWPIVGARTITSIGTVLFLFWRSRTTNKPPALPHTFLPPRSTMNGIAAAGTLDVAANVMFLFALQSGALVVVSLLTSLYPVATVILARVILSERMTRNQLIGLSMALVATGCISVG